MSYFKALWRIISASMVNDMTYNYSGLNRFIWLMKKLWLILLWTSFFYSLKGGEFCLGFISTALFCHLEDWP